MKEIKALTDIRYSNKTMNNIHDKTIFRLYEGLVFPHNKVTFSHLFPMETNSFHDTSFANLTQQY
jgi:hypothetical protein